MNRLPILLVLFVGTSASAVPASFSHQGRLLDELGIPLEGEHTLDSAL